MAGIIGSTGATRSWRLGPFLALLLVVSGCAGADLPAVRRFAKTSAATADYRELVTDYVFSPKRQMRYVPDRFAAQWEAQYQERLKQKPALEAAQLALVKYMNALGDIAADQPTVVDAELESLQKALTGAKFVASADSSAETETGTAAAGVAKILARIAVDGWRRQQAAQIIHDADPHIQQLTAGLREVISKDFAQSFDIEAEALNKYFTGMIDAANGSMQWDTLASLARVLWKERAEQITGRRDGIPLYVEVLSAIAKGHADLAASAANLGDSALTARLARYASDIQALYRALAKQTN